MVNEVNKLIYNLLLDARAVFLPDVGTLHIVRHEAKRDGRRVVSPRYNVEFSSHLKGSSIVDHIARLASCPHSQAEDVYKRWLKRVTTDKSIDIEGVGSLHMKSFVADKALLDELNRLPESLTITRKRGGKTLVWLLALVTVVVVGVVGWRYLNDGRVESVVVEPEIASEENAQYVEPKIDTLKQNTIETPAVEPRSYWYDSDDIRHWVVVGSYSTEDNAQRAIQSIEDSVDDVSCKVYTLGKMYAVVAFGSSDRAACEEFIRSHKASFKQAWIHTPKRFK